MNDSPRFAVGDEVVDADDDDSGVMIVLDPDRGRADEVYVEAIDATVTDVNPEYPPDDRVVRCIHASWLEHHAGAHWPDWSRETFPERLREFAAAWSLNPRTYDYPEGRLERYSNQEPSSDPPPVGEHTQASFDDWMS